MRNNKTNRIQMKKEREREFICEIMFNAHQPRRKEDESE